MLSSDEDEDDKSRMTLLMRVAGVSSREEVWMTVHWLACWWQYLGVLPGSRCQVLRGLVVVITLVLVSTTLLTYTLQSPVYLL